MRKAIASLALSVCALVLTGPAWATDYNDDADGNWNTDTTWDPTGAPYPQSGDTATLDSNVVTVNIDLTGADAPDQINLAGGTLHFNSGRTVDSPVSVIASSTVTADGNYGKLNGLITGSATVTLIKAGTHHIYLEGSDNPAYLGQWRVNESYLRPRKDGALGRGTVTINDGGIVYVESEDQTAAKAPVRVIVNDGGRLRNNGRKIYGWDIELNDGGGLSYRGEFRDGTVTLTGTCNIFGEDANELKIYSTLHGDGTLNFPSGHRYGSVGLYADNHATYSGQIVVDVTPDSQNNARNLYAKADGALGSGTVSIGGSVAGLQVTAAQSAAKAPAAVLIADGATIYNSQPLDGWHVTVDNGNIRARSRWESTSSLDLSGDCTLYGSDGGTGIIEAPITGSGTLTILKKAYSDGAIRLDADNSGYAGHIVIDGSCLYVVDVRHANGLGNGPVTVKGSDVNRARGALGVGNIPGGLATAVTLDGGGTLSNSGQNATIASTATVTLMGTGQVLCTGAWNADRTFTLDGRFTGSGALRFECDGDNSDNMIFHLNNPANDYSGGTILDGWYSYNHGGRGQVFATADGVLGTGAVSVLNGRLITDPALGGGSVADTVFTHVPVVDVRGGTLELKSTENAGKIQLHEGGALINTAGATNITYGPAGNIHVHDGAILHPSLPLPTATQFESSGKVYLGTEGLLATESVTISGVVKGLATIDSYPTLSGTVSDAAGAGISLYAQDLRRMTLDGARLLTTGVLDLEGGGPHGTENNGTAWCGFAFAGADNLTAVGSPTVINMNAGAKLYFDTPDGLPGGATLNVNDGFLEVGSGAALSNTALVNVNSGGAFRMSTALTTGSIVLKDGGGIWAGAAGLDRVTVEGGQIVLRSESAVSGDLPTNGKADFLLYDTNNDEFGGDLVLSADTRLTAVNDASNVRIGSSTSTGQKITTVSTGTIGGRIAANPTASYANLNVNAKIEFPAKTLIINDAGTFRALQKEGRGFEDVGIAQDATVTLNNTGNDIGDIWIQAGRLYISTSGGATGIMGRLGNAGEVRIDDGAEIYFSDTASGLPITFSGNGTIVCKEPDARRVAVLGQRDAAGAHVGSYEPGNSVGVLTVDGGMGFMKTDYGSGDYEYSWLVVDVAGSGGVPGTDHDQVVVTSRGTFGTGWGGDLANGELRVALPVPSFTLNPTALATRDMVIVDAPGGIASGALNDVALADGVGSHWAITSGTALTYDRTHNEVLLHGSAIYWTAHKGDATLNDVVDVLDLARLANNFGKNVANGDDVTWETADFNLDGIVDVLDLAAIANNFGYDGTGGGDGGGAPVPEPASLAVLALGGAALLRRRRR